VGESVIEVWQDIPRLFLIKLMQVIHFYSRSLEHMHYRNFINFWRPNAVKIKVMATKNILFLPAFVHHGKFMEIRMRLVDFVRMRFDRR
jgi:hypothetical protein